MAGLMPSGAPQPSPAQAASPQPGAAPAEAEAMPEDGQPATPEEQAMYEELVARGFMLLYDKEKGIRPGIREMIEADTEDPGRALGEAAGMILARVDESAAEAGAEIPGEVKEAAAAEIFENVADAATQAGIHDFAGDDAAFQKGFLIAMDTARQQAVAGGRLDPEAAKADLAELARADAEGKLDGIMAGMGGEQAPAPMPGAE